MTSRMPWTPGRGDVVWVRTARKAEGAPAGGPESGGQETRRRDAGAGESDGRQSAGRASEAHDLPARRLALVLSPAAYSAKVGLVVLCLIADQARGYPFEVELPGGLPVSGVVLADRVTSLAWRSCVRLAFTVPSEVTTAVQEKLLVLLAPQGGGVYSPASA